MNFFAVKRRHPPLPSERPRQAEKTIENRQKYSQRAHRISQENRKLQPATADMKLTMTMTSPEAIEDDVVI